LKRPVTSGVLIVMNERLRTTMLRAGVTTEGLAGCVGVDVKTVERWLTLGRVPHRRHRWTAAKELRVDESYLWPQVPNRTPAREREATASELLEIYPDRASVPRQVWLRLLGEALENVDVLVFSGTFFAQTQPHVARMLTDAAGRGATVRLCFGDPESEAVAIRDREEGIAGTLAAKIRSALTYYEPLLDIDRCEVRLHSTTLYASLFRYDDEIMVNPHAYGKPASANPTLHLRMLDGARVAQHYLSSFERVWASAVPWSGRS
jgi:transcriptional regulator with XRE-family HTH domain